MDTAFNVLVIILSVFLAIFLILGITILAYAYKLAKAAKRLGEKAEVTADNFKGFAEGVKRSVAPAMAAKVLEKAVRNFAKKSKVKVKK